MIADDAPKPLNQPQLAVIYCRVSSRAQELDGNGLQSQETRCRQYAEAKGYRIGAVFPDTVSGGGDFMKRPGMKALLSFLDAQPHESFVVIFDDLKRYSRDVEFHLKLRREMDARNATRECLNFNFSDSPEGTFNEIVIAASGQLEREQNRRQVIQKRKARMQKGYWVDRPPIGYRYETSRAHGKILVPNPPFDDIIRQAFEGYASGRFQTQAEIKRFFEADPRFPKVNGGYVRQQRVTDILTHPIYAGYICCERYSIAWQEGQHTPLVSLKTFDAVQKRRASNAKAPRRANIGDAFILRGMVVCDSCSVPLRSSFSKGRSKQYAYYLCQTKTCDHYGKSIKRDQIENEVGDLIKELQPTKGLIATARAMFKDFWDARTEQAEEQRKSAKSQLRALDKQKDGLLNRLVDATDSAVVRAYEEKLGAISREQARLREQKDQTAAMEACFEEKLEPALTFLANPWKLWESGSIHARRLVLKLAFADRIVYHRNKGPRTTQKTLIFNSLEGLAGPGFANGAGEGT